MVVMLLLSLVGWVTNMCVCVACVCVLSVCVFRANVQRSEQCGGKPGEEFSLSWVCIALINGKLRKRANLNRISNQRCAYLSG